MNKEIKHPTLNRPYFENESYDYRNIENAGKCQGIGHAGKIGSYGSHSLDAVPQKPHKIMVKRDHEG